MQENDHSLFAVSQNLSNKSIRVNNGQKNSHVCMTSWHNHIFMLSIRYVHITTNLLQVKNNSFAVSYFIKSKQIYMEWLQEGRAAKSNGIVTWILYKEGKKNLWLRFPSAELISSTQKRTNKTEKVSHSNTKALVDIKDSQIFWDLCFALSFRLPVISKCSTSPQR